MASIDLEGNYERLLGKSSKDMLPFNVKCCNVIKQDWLRIIENHNRHSNTKGAVSHPETKQCDDAADTQHRIPQPRAADVPEQFDPRLHEALRTVAEPEKAFDLRTSDYNGRRWREAGNYRNRHELHQKTCINTHNYRQQYCFCLCYSSFRFKGKMTEIRIRGHPSVNLFVVCLISLQEFQIM